MADLPIIFSAPMIFALLREIEAPGTGKTQTRRVLKVDLSDGIDAIFSDGRDMWEGCSWTGERRTTIPIRYYVGDRLYVREAHSLHHSHGQARTDGRRWGPWGELPFSVSPDGTQVAYFRESFNRSGPPRWRPSIHMPRWASRITLDVTGVRVQRLQEISEVDAKAEGVGSLTVTAPALGCSMSAVEGFTNLWNSLHGPNAWDENPWVAAYTFRPILGNIDAVAAVPCDAKTPEIVTQSNLCETDGSEPKG